MLALSPVGVVVVDVVTGGADVVVDDDAEAAAAAAAFDAAVMTLIKCEGEGGDITINVELK